MAEEQLNTAEAEVEFEDDGFFEPTIEEAIMASGLHKQFVVD
ncbi:MULTISPECIES: hypothetical protein [Streptomycetaceae]|jgi:hypothetical protein|nr:hypothetical protein [Streptomyces acidipaludis]